MKVEVIANTPSTRCYLCRKPDVDKLCHHCGRAICSSHGSTAIPAGMGYENPEFSDLGLDPFNNDNDIVHCEDCIHSVRSYQWLVPRAIKTSGVGFAITLLGAFLRADWLIITGLLLLVGGILWWRWIKYQHDECYEQARHKNRAPFPVVPSIRTVSITEQVSGTTCLDETGHYSTQLEKIQGKLSLALQFSHRDKERIGAYLKKYNLIMNRAIPFHAGFLVLKGAPAIEFEDPGLFVDNRPNTIALQGTVGDQPFLFDDDARHDSNWTKRFIYTVAGDKPNNLPVQIIPTLAHEGAQRAINLVVQVSPELIGSKHVGIIRVEKLTLYAPQRLSKVAMIQPSAVIAVVTGDDPNAEHQQEITWKDVSIKSNQRRECRQTFYVRFENKIEPSTQFRGKLTLSLSDTLSTLDHINFYYAWGQKRAENITLQKKTYLYLDFELNLNGLRFQEMASDSAQLVRVGVVPNHAIIAKLTDDLNDAGVYVKRVIENPARTSKEGAHITNRYWDIAGRYYEGVYPIDFHLVMTGEDAHGRPADSKVQVDVTVQGVVTDEEMRRKVTYLLARLTAITENTIDSLPTAPSRGADLVVDPDAPSPPPDKQPLPFFVAEDFDSSAQVTHVLTMLHKLDEALIEGRISEGRYNEMQVRYNDQLAELGHTA